MKTYNDIYLSARRRLRAAGIEAYDLEARLIVAYASGKTREELLNLSRLYVTDNAMLKTLEEVMERRLKGEPVAYIVGEWEFYGLPIIVNESVMIPRVDTELLAEQAIKLLKRRAMQTRVLDLCTGSGCVGLAIAASSPRARIVMADSSEAALAVCRANMLKNRLSRNVTAIEVDVLESPPTLLGSFDMIVCNPPYIPSKDIESLDASVRSYEPIAALDGGPDGLYFFRAIVTNWAQSLNHGGCLLFECGFGQSEAVRGIMLEGGFASLKTHMDTQGVERVLMGIRS